MQFVFKIVIQANSSFKGFSKQVRTSFRLLLFSFILILKKNNDHSERVETRILSVKLIISVKLASAANGAKFVSILSLQLA